MNKYYVVSVDIKDADVFDEVKNDALVNFLCDGVNEFDLNEDTVDEILGDRAYSGESVPGKVLDEVEGKSSLYGTTYTFYFYKDDCEKRSKDFLSFTQDKNLKSELIEKEYEDWNEEWRKHYKVIEISKDMRVIPQWEKEQANECDIIIYPGQGFGTGNHETTFLCLKIYSDLIGSLENKRCLDFGCGSGILGIGALKNGFEYVEFCDVDRGALDNCVQNLQLNFDEAKLTGNKLVSRERFKVEEKFDLVFANILLNVLELEKEVIYASLKPGGKLIVSGLLSNQVEEISKLYESIGLKKDLDLIKGDWAAVLFTR